MTHRETDWESQGRGRKEQGMFTPGFSEELGRPDFFHERGGEEKPPDQAPGPQADRVKPKEARASDTNTHTRTW